MANKATQKEAIFYTLLKRFRAKDAQYIPVHQLMGEVYIEELGKWGYVSYECSARASEMIKENPNLIMRTRIRGKSGAQFYGYKLNPFPTPEMIRDPKLREFYYKIKPAARAASKREVDESRRQADETFAKL